MATISDNIGTAQTLRQFIEPLKGGTILSGDEAEKSIPVGAKDVNVIWEGDSYYITYKTDGENNTNIYTIDDITEYLPLTIAVPKPAEENAEQPN